MGLIRLLEEGGIDLETPEGDDPIVELISRAYQRLQGGSVDWSANKGHILNALSAAMRFELMDQARKERRDQHNSGAVGEDSEAIEVRQARVGEAEPPKPQNATLDFAGDSATPDVLQQPSVDEVIARIVETFEREIASKLEELLPAEYAARREAVGALKDANRRAVAKAMQEALNDEASTWTIDTLEQKREFAKWLNAELRHLDLALVCPKTGEVATLVPATSKTPAGRFQFETKDSKGHPKRTSSSVDLPPLKVIPIPFGQSRESHRRTGRSI